MSMGGSAPNYYGAAEAQADASREAIDAQTQANRPNITTPWGSLTWNRTQTPGVVNPQRQALEQQLQSIPTDAFGNVRRRAIEQQLASMPQYTTAPSTAWGMNVQLTPEQQQALEAQQQIQLGRSDVARNLLGQASTELQTPLDYSSVGEARKAAEDALYGRSASRLDPRFASRDEALRTQLANQGLDIGSEAYRNAMDDLGRERTDAYQQAQYQSEIGGGEEAQRQMGLEAQRRGFTLNLLNSALSGQQVGMPEMPGFSQAGAAQPANYLGAATAQGQYSLANSQAQNQMFGDIFGGIGSFGAGLFGFSDARLKRRIRRSKIEIIPGVRLARWEWPDGSSELGVIAQDVAKVAPQLVARHASGYLMVDYGGIS